MSMLRAVVVRGLLALVITLGVFAALPSQVQSGVKSIEKRALRHNEKKLKRKDKCLKRQLKRDKRQEKGDKKAIKHLGGKKKKK
jgi:hypothetical protein